MGELVVANKTHHKEWKAKLQRVWRREDTTGYITIVEDLFALKDRYEVRREGKPYAFDRTYDSLDEAISMAEASMLDGECRYIDNDRVIPGSKPLTEEEMRSVGILKETNAAAEVVRVLDEKIKDQFDRIEGDIEKFEKSLESEEVTEKQEAAERKRERAEEIELRREQTEHAEFRERERERREME